MAKGQKKAVVRLSKTFVKYIWDHLQKKNLFGYFTVLLGLIISGIFQPLFNFQDRYEGSRGTYMKGMLPVHHKGKPWGFTPEEIPDLKGHTILVTGANGGLGYWTAHHLASKRATVILACRSAEKCKEAAEKIEFATSFKVDTAHLDLSSFASIQAAAAEIAEKYPQLDSLVLNAGVMMPPFMTTREGLEMQIGVNHFGHFLLTKLLLPQLEAAASAKGVATVVAVSSAAHYDSYKEGILPTVTDMNDKSKYNRFKAYGQSKLANVLFAQELAARVKSKNILVNSVHPGAVATDLARHLFSAIAKVSRPMADMIMLGMTQISWDPRDACLSQLYAAVGPSLKAGQITGKYFHPIARETVPDLHAIDELGEANRARLWAMTEEFIEHYISSLVL